MAVPPKTTTMDEKLANLKICIIGAGMGGLASALALAKHGFTNIHVYEAARDLGFVGAGIQLAPNMARVLDGLGVWDEIEAEAVDVQEASVRQGATNEELAHVDLSYIRKEYSHPHMVGHRTSLANGLYNGCKREPEKVQFHFGCPVSNVDVRSTPPSYLVSPRDESQQPYTETADVVLAADGIKSATREAVLDAAGSTASISDTGQAAYRIILTREQLSPYPDLLELLDSNAVTRWIGEKRHIIAYPISRKQMYNLSTIQPDANFAAAPSATYTTRGSKKAMLEVFGDFDPMVIKMLDLVPEGEVCEWKLRTHLPLDTWTNGGAVALIGDACHPTQPHLNQGAAQAIEDAAVIGVVLSRLPSTDPKDIGKALKVYEMVRKERAETLVALAAASGKAMHLGEGAAKEERDRQFARLKAGGKGPVPDKWADADTQKMIYGWDAVKEAETQFDGLFYGTKEN